MRTMIRRAQDRLLMRSGLTLRAAATLQPLYVLPMVWRDLPRPLWTLILVVALVVVGSAVMAWWFIARRLDLRTAWVDVPVGTVALLVGWRLAAPTGGVGWTLFVYPYSVLVLFGYAIGFRRLEVLLGWAALWAATDVVAAILVGRGAAVDLVSSALGYLIYPVLGWSCGRILRRDGAELATARRRAVLDSAELAAAAERRRIEVALHDRVLQTLETAVRLDLVRDDRLRERATSGASWLRHYVETGQTIHCGGLASGLADAARAAQRDGLVVEVHDAAVRDLPVADLGTAQCDALVWAVSRTVAAFAATSGAVTVRAAPDATGVLVSVLADGVGAPPGGLADAHSRLAAAGGWLMVEPIPYAELWVPRREASRPRVPVISPSARG
jgi:hypothetical protein